MARQLNQNILRRGDYQFKFGNEDSSKDETWNADTEDSSKDESWDADDVKTLYPKSISAINTIDDDIWKLIEEKVINNPNLKWEDTAKIGVLPSDNGNYVSQESDTSIRNCKISFLDYDEELDTFFKKIIGEYNYEISGWKYNIDTLETMQLTHYGSGDFYDWHIDEHSVDLVKDDKEFNRKISVTIWLNDPEEYVGGEFDLEVRGPSHQDWINRYETFKLPKKSIIIFPSNKFHRVRPVTSGVRKSLVLWFQGPPFR